MSYQVIARKWRPQTFEEVTGQEHITRTLRNAIEHERLHHAYLFSGARGVGKTTTARLLAKAINCHKSTKPTVATCSLKDPDACASCREIAEGRSIDVLEIDAASTTGVQNVRDSIIDTIGIAPARDRYKVFVIDEVHMLSTQAFNALLKTLEEPPPRVVFIMATTEHHKVPDTILSRCQQFEFRTIATAKIAERLRLIADAEKITIPDEAIREIARAGEGSMRDAQSAFDQVISFAGQKIKTDDVEAALGIAGSEVLARVMQGIAEGNPATALAVVEDVVMRGQDLRNFCKDLLAHIRDLLAFKVAGESVSTIENRDSLRTQADAFSESDLVRFFHSLTETETTLRVATHPRYQLEVGLVKLMEMRRLAPIQELIQRVAALEESLRTGKPLAVQESPPTSSTSGSGGAPRSPRSGAKSRGASTAKTESTGAFDPTSRMQESASSGLIDSNSGNAATARAFESAVEETALPSEPIAASQTTEPATKGSFVESLKTELENKRRMFLVTALDASRIARLDDRELYVEFSPEAKHLRDTLAKSENVKVLREIARDLLGFEIGVRICVTEQDGGNDDAPLSREDEARRERKRLREFAEQHPAVQQVLNTFHGEIVDVRRVKSSKAPE